MDFIAKQVLGKLVPADEVATIVLEPIQGEGRYIVPPPTWLPCLRALCDRHGILLVTDEAQSGFERTAKMFTVEHWGVDPDIMFLAKGPRRACPWEPWLAGGG